MTRSQSGFTLFEVILSITLLSSIVFTSVVFFGAVLSSRAKTNATQEVHDAARIASAFITKRIRSAASIESASSTFGAHPGVLTLAMDDPSLDPTILSVSPDSDLQITEGNSSPVSLTSNRVTITNLVFTETSYPGSGGGIGIDLTIAYRNPGGDPNYDYSQRYNSFVLLRP
ncbi:hypothetical protein HYV71_04840 [Candidatus Uhrbacteria bacterium]|nr:hypothetical protein [Candidatus Uhrbacteria bacterium]